MKSCRVNSGQTIVSVHDGMCTYLSVSHVLNPFSWRPEVRVGTASTGSRDSRIKSAFPYSELVSDDERNHLFTKKGLQQTNGFAQLYTSFWFCKKQHGDCMFIKGNIHACGMCSDPCTIDT